MNTVEAIMLGGTEISPLLMATIVAALMGAFVLNHFTRIDGIIGFFMNAAGLFAGAQAAKYLLSGLSLPFDFLVDRTLLISFTGMVVASFGILLLFSRSPQG